jgi:hypothetical protein
LGLKQVVCCGESLHRRPIGEKMLATCDKCKLNREVHSKHYCKDGSILNFCNECVWRLEKKGFPDIDSFLKEKWIHEM